MFSTCFSVHLPLKRLQIRFALSRQPIQEILSPCGVAVVGINSQDSLFLENANQKERGKTKKRSSLLTRQSFILTIVKPNIWNHITVPTFGLTFKIV